MARKKAQCGSCGGYGDSWETVEHTRDCDMPYQTTDQVK